MVEELGEVSVGDTLILLVGSGPSHKQVTVTRVGYKYLYVTDGDHKYESRDRYDIRTGHCVSDRGYGYPRRVLTLEGYADYRRRWDAVAELSEAGVSLSFHLSKSLSTQQLEAILAIVNPEEV